VLGTGDAERFRRAIAYSKLVWIQNSTHVPHLEQPEITAREILAFL
jgi:pimeloyl-ACP methyl ester carboxylesterase